MNSDRESNNEDDELVTTPLDELEKDLRIRLDGLSSSPRSELLRKHARERQETLARATRPHNEDLTTWIASVVAALLEESSRTDQGTEAAFKKAEEAQRVLKTAGSAG